ncbi:MAG: hypothetical protein HC780_29240 [Leptolyngbyaceae cyanobacterium CSU_1_3]|nr:hypothetical protein [Leptolyngbyaceae cyanobacterium CSU_1_3]
MVYTSDGSTVFLSTPEELVAINVATGSELYRTALPSSLLQLNPDNSTLIADERGNMRAIRAVDGMLLWELGFHVPDRQHGLNFTEIGAFAISPDNQYIAVGEVTRPGVLGGIDDGQIALIRIVDGTIVQEYRGQERGIGSLMFTTDSKTFLSSNGEEIARWDVEPRPSWLIWLPIATIGLVIVHGILNLLVAWWDQGRTRQI